MMFLSDYFDDFKRYEPRGLAVIYCSHQFTNDTEFEFKTSKK